jgi:hypothetical protein
MNQLYAMEMPGWWTRDGISDYASPIMNIGSSTYENLSELAIRTMMDDWKRNGTLPGEYEGVSGEILDYTTATNEDVSYYLTEEIVSHFANRFGSAEDDVSAECRTNTACLFYAPYYDANRPSYFNFCYLTITFGPDYDAKHYAKYHYMDSFDLSACKPGESYTFLLCSLWGLYANGQWRTFNVENITTGPNADEWW